MKFVSIENIRGYLLSPLPEGNRTLSKNKTLPPDTAPGLSKHKSWFLLYLFYLRFMDVLTLSIVRYYKKNTKSTLFRKLDLFPSSGEGKGDIYSVGSLRKSYLKLSNGPNKVGVSHPFIWGRKQIQFPKQCVILIFSIRGDGQSPKPQ
jgi:hypothetical protein